MSDFDDPSKVTRLQVARAPVLQVNYDDEAALRHQVAELLAEADPLPAVVEPEPQCPPARKQEVAIPAPAPQIDPGPKPGHRNGMICPQCDRWTWRATEECRHCYYNLFNHAEQIAQERREEFLAYRRIELSRWARGLALGGIAIIYFSKEAPGSLGGSMVFLGLAALFGAFVCGKAIALIDNRIKR